MVVWGIPLDQKLHIGASNSVQSLANELADIGSEMTQNRHDRNELSSQISALSSQVNVTDQRYLELTERALELTKLAQTLGTSLEGSYANSGMTDANADTSNLVVRSVDPK